MSDTPLGFCHRELQSLLHPGGNSLGMGLPAGPRVTRSTSAMEGHPQPLTYVMGRKNVKPKEEINGWGNRDHVGTAHAKIMKGRISGGEK